MWGHAGEAMGGEDGGESDEGVVAEVKQEANEDSAGAGAGECEDDAYGDQHGNEAPRPAELCAVQNAEQRSGEYDSYARAGLDCLVGLGAEVFGHARKTGREKRVEIAAEDGFFNKRCDQDGHGHQGEGAGTAFEKILDGKVVRSLEAGTGDGDADGQGGTAAEIKPWTGGNVAVRIKLAPAQSGPEGTVAQNGESHVEKQQNQQEPKDVRADCEARLGLEKLLHLLLGEVLAGGIVNDDRDLNDGEAAESK